MKKIPKDVKIAINDKESNNHVSFEIQRWIKHYNVENYSSNNSSCLHHFAKAKNLKHVSIWALDTCKEEDLKIFLQLKYLHSLLIWFARDVK